jgi:hypothetical protein
MGELEKGLSKKEIILIVIWTILIIIDLIFMGASQ